MCRGRLGYDTCCQGLGHSCQVKGVS
jgi:hypothetical protein